MKFATRSGLEVEGAVPHGVSNRSAVGLSDLKIADPGPNWIVYNVAMVIFQGADQPGQFATLKRI